MPGTAGRTMAAGKPGRSMVAGIGKPGRADGTAKDGMWLGFTGGGGIPTPASVAENASALSSSPALAGDSWPPKDSEGVLFQSKHTSTRLGLTIWSPEQLKAHGGPSQVRSPARSTVQYNKEVLYSAATVSFANQMSWHATQSRLKAQNDILRNVRMDHEPQRSH